MIAKAVGCLTNGFMLSLIHIYPAVGSGHFLVSALNELILLKYELGILVDATGKRIRKADYQRCV